MFYGSIISCLFVLLYFILKDKKGELIEKIIKIIAVLFICLCFINLFLPDAFALRFIWNFDYLRKHHNPIHAIMRCFYAMAIITLPIAIFFKSKNFVRASIYILLPTCLINIIFYKQFIFYYTSPLTSYAPVFGKTLLPYLTNRIFRTTLFGLIMSFELLQCLYLLLKYNKYMVINSFIDFSQFAVISILLFISNMPIYTLQQIFGHVGKVTFNVGDISHILFMLIIIIEAIVLYTIFKNETYENKYILLLVMNLSLLFQYNSFFKTDDIIIADRYPLQLCNIAGAFLMVTLLTKNERMFHFTAVVNVIGAIIAIILCDSTKDVGILYCMNIHYMVEHANVLLIPVLGLILQVFKPFTLKDVKDVIVGFTIYFITVFLIGTFLNGMKVKTGNMYFDCNYLFMFDKNAAMRLVAPWVGKLFDIKLTLFKYYKVYLVQILIYLVFLTICIGTFYLIYFVFSKKRIENENLNTNTIIENKITKIENK